MKNNLQEKFSRALKIFVDRHKKNNNVFAILVSGSCIHSTPDKNSDLDVYVLLEKAKMRERGNTWINGVEIEYFINPVNQVRCYFETETGNKAPFTAHMFANSQILYQKDKTIAQLIKEAKVILKKKMPVMKKMDLEFARYSMDDTIKDLEDVYLKKDIFAFSLIASNLLQESLNIFFKIHRIPKEKSKRLQKKLKSIDRNFEKLYTSALIEKDIGKQYRNINRLVRYAENLIGGKRPKEWILRSKCKVR
jgi:predicted nucleotidyltransferase